MKRFTAEGQGFFRRYLGFIIVIPVALISGFLALRNSPGKNQAVAQKESSAPAIVHYESTPRPTPRQITPPPPTPQPEEKVVPAAPTEDNKPAAPPVLKPAVAPLSTGIKGNGDPSGLAAAGNGIGNGTFGGEPNQGGLGTELERYAGAVQIGIKDILQKNPSTKKANFGRIVVEIFPDPDGTITALTVIGEGGLNSALVDVLKKALIGSKVSPPPHDFYAHKLKFIKMSLSASPPNTQ